MSYDHDQQRDYAEEAYLKNFCPECDGGCTSTDGHAELEADGARTPTTWRMAAPATTSPAARGATRRRHREVP